MNAATSVAGTSNSAARTSSAGSHGRTSNNRLAINAPEKSPRECRAPSDADLHERSAQHHHDRRPVRAERHAHADLGRPPLDGVRGDAVEPHGREQEPDRAEQPRQARDQSCCANWRRTTSAYGWTRPITKSGATAVSRSRTAAASPGGLPGAQITMLYR